MTRAPLVRSSLSIAGIFAASAAHAAAGDSPGDSSGEVYGPGDAGGIVDGGVPKESIFDGSFIGSLVSGSEFTGIGIVDIIFFALLVFALLSVMRVLGASRAAQNQASRQKPESRHTLPGGRGSQGHDPWARLRSKDDGQDRAGNAPPPPRERPTVRPEDLRPPKRPEAASGKPGGGWDSLRGDKEPAAAPPSTQARQSAPASAPSSARAGGQAAASDYSPAAASIRKDFDLEDFLKGARIIFARLQESFDRRDFEDIALFATPEVVDEMQAQAEKEGEPSGTDILLVKASLISLNVENGQEVAEVFFDVLMREGKKAEPAQVKEVWYFVHPVDGGFWQLDGIRQVE